MIRNCCGQRQTGTGSFEYLYNRNAVRADPENDGACRRHLCSLVSRSSLIDLKRFLPASFRGKKLLTYYDRIKFQFRVVSTYVREGNFRILSSKGSFFSEEPAIPRISAASLVEARNSSAKGWQTRTTIKPSDLRPTLYGPRPDGARLCEFFVDFRSILTDQTRRRFVRYPPLLLPIFFLTRSIRSTSRYR